MGEPTRAEELYVCVCIGLVAVLLFAGCVDGWLSITGQQTISAFLRANPKYFFTPLVVFLVFVALLTSHLFLLP